MVIAQGVHAAGMGVVGDRVQDVSEDVEGVFGDAGGVGQGRVDEKEAESDEERD